jgi:SAM-dependent MidA family methyltransferase
LKALLHKGFKDLKRKIDTHLRISKIEGRLDDVDRVIGPDGWIGEAFNVLETHIDQKFSEVDQRFNSVDQRFDSMDAKLDIIMGHITGLNQDG